MVIEMENIFGKYAGVGAVGVILALAVSGAQAADYCTNKYAASASATQAKFDPQLTSVYAEIKRVQEAGLDPDKYLVEYRGELVTLVQKANNIAVSYRTEMSQASGEAEGCAAAIAPANLLVNGVIKTYAIWATYGLALLLPDRMTNVDVGEIAHGKPFGGDHALVPEVREFILRGDRGTIANIVRDPWRCVTFQRKC